MTPDSQKSTLDKAKDTVTGAGDKAQRYALPFPCLPLTY